MSDEKIISINRIMFKPYAISVRNRNIRIQGDSGLFDSNSVGSVDISNGIDVCVVFDDGRISAESIVCGVSLEDVIKIINPGNAIFKSGARNIPINIMNPEEDDRKEREADKIHIDIISRLKRIKGIIVVE